MRALAGASAPAADAGRELVDAARRAGWEGSTLRGLISGGTIDTGAIAAAGPALDRTESLLGALVLEQVEQVGGKIVGGILNNLDARRARGYPSYQHYYYSYRYHPERDAVDGNGGMRKRAADTLRHPEELWR